jgi:hypothetical protein
VREEHTSRLRVSDDRVLRKILGFKRSEKRMHKTELYDLYSSPIKSSRM